MNDLIPMQSSIISELESTFAKLDVLENQVNIIQNNE